MTDAALGSEIEVPTIDSGKSKVKIPAGTQSGKTV
jgi:molecular chaperone DnaJ